MAARNDDGLYAKARSLFISKATMDDLTGRATPRQTDAASRPFDTEPANGERSKRERLLRRARFPVVKSLDGYDFSNVRLPDGYALDGLLDLDFVPCAQDLVFYDKTGRGKTYLAIGLGMRAVERGLNVRFHQTAELVLQLGKAKRDGNLDAMPGDIGRADPIILDEFGYVPFDIDGARLLHRIIAGSYERRSIASATNIGSGKWGTVFADDKLAAAIIDRIVASWTPARVHRAEPPRQRGAHVRKDVRRTRVRTQGEDKGTGRNAPWLKSKFFRDQSRNADSTKYAASPALRPPPEAPLCTRRCPRRPSN